MMRKGGETPDEEKARFKVSREFSKRVKEILGDAARHRLRARRAGHLPHLGVHGQAVRQGRDLRRHHRLQPRLRRALPVDAPEADHRLALRQRLRVQQGQRADRVGPDPAGAVAHARLRGRARGAPADAARTSTSARSRSSSAPTRTDRARRPTARARSARRWAHDPGGDPLADQPVPGRQVRRGLAAGRGGRARLRRHPLVVLRARSTGGSTSSRRASSRRRRTSSATGTRSGSPSTGSSWPAATRCRSCRPSGRSSARARRPTQPCSSGAIVSPASFSCSQ